MDDVISTQGDHYLKRNHIVYSIVILTHNMPSTLARGFFLMCMSAKSFNNLLPLEKAEACLKESECTALGFPSSSPDECH